MVVKQGIYYNTVRDSRDAMIVDAEQIRYVFHITHDPKLGEVLSNLNIAIQNANRWLMENQEVKTNDGEGDIRPETSTAATA